MNRKRILFLGGAYSQIPIIKEAKNRGWYIITCDYLPDNPGHKYADVYHNVSTTDFDGVLEVAKKTSPDFIIAYASDPAAPTAAWVSEQLGLPGNSYKSIQTLAEKDLFRKFLKKNGFNTPNAVSIESEKDYDLLKELSFPIIVKPTDSSGSKGVSRVDNKSEIKKAIEYALMFSRNKRVIAEEFVDNELGDIHGDGFVYNGNLIFCYLGDHIYSEGSNIYNPCGTLWPSKIDKNIIRAIETDLKRLIKLSGFQNGAINIEARYSSNGKTYIMEVGPRNGGHFVPQAIKYSTEFDMVSAILDNCEGIPIKVPTGATKPGAYYAIHSNMDGVLDKILISTNLKPYIKEYHQYIQPGEQVKSFQGANAAIGILLLSFSTIKEMEHYISNMDKYVKVNLK